MDDAFALERSYFVEQGPGRGTLYNALLTIGANGELLNHHRKLVPTYTERMVWGAGDAVGLRAVETPAGRVGGLICWEHWMPLVRQSLHIAGEDVHVALWPSVKEMFQIASRHYAFEGRCFVVAAGGIMRRSDLPRELEALATAGNEESEFLLNGGSAVIGPDGLYVAGPAFGSEVIILARINLDRIREESMTLDVTGHFNRPDLFDFGLKGTGEKKLSGKIDVRGFIGIASFCDRPDSLTPQTEQTKSVRGYFITGGRDHTLENASQVKNVLKENKIPFAEEVHPDLGHEFPADFAASFDKAIDFIFTERE